MHTLNRKYLSLIWDWIYDSRYNSSKLGNGLPLALDLMVTSNFGADFLAKATVNKRGSPNKIYKTTTEFG